MTIVTAPARIQFPNGRWLSTQVVGPAEGRCLIKILGHSGRSTWVCALVTAPEASIIRETRWYKDWVYLSPGTYRVDVGNDRMGNRVVRLFFADPPVSDSIIMVSVNGHLGTSEGEMLAAAEGFSRTQKMGSAGGWLWPLMGS